MKLMELVKKTLKLKLFWSNNMLSIDNKKIAICIKNNDYLASLEVKKYIKFYPMTKQKN